MTGRERQDPDERFAGDEHLFDLAASARDLQREQQEARHGHRQVTLVHDDGITVVLFAFEAGGQLANHSADRLVMIQRRHRGAPRNVVSGIHAERSLKLCRCRWLDHA